MTLMLAQLRSFYVGDKAQLRSAYYVETAGLAIAPTPSTKTSRPLVRRHSARCIGGQGGG